MIENRGAAGYSMSIWERGYRRAHAIDACDLAYRATPLPPYFGNNISRNINLRRGRRSKIFSALKLFAESSAVGSYGRFLGIFRCFVPHCGSSRCVVHVDFGSSEMPGVGFPGASRDIVRQGKVIICKKIGRGLRIIFSSPVAEPNSSFRAKLTSGRIAHKGKISPRTLWGAGPLAGYFPRVSPWAIFDSSLREK